jgi:hypothetical protein
MLPVSTDPTRKLTLLRAAFWVLITAAALILLLPVPLPFSLRAAVAATDLITAAVVWLALRQHKRR